MIAAMLESIAARDPATVALRQGSCVVRYGELHARLHHLGQFLAAQNLGPGSTAAVWMPNSAASALVVLAGARRGIRLLLLDASLKPAEIESYCTKAGSRQVLSAETASLPGTGLTVIPIPAASLGADAPDSTAGGLTLPPVMPAAAAASDFLLLSSGTSGQPKIVVRTAAQTAAALAIFAASLPLSPTDKVLALLPFCHSFGLLYVLLSTLKAGAQVVIEPFSPRSTAAAVARHGITVLPATPYMFRMLSETTFAVPPDFASLRLAISAGSALPLAVALRFRGVFGVGIAQSYGSTETGPAALGNPETQGEQAGCIGKPYAGVRFEFGNAPERAAPDTGLRPIAVRSPANADGYLGDPETTASVFQQGAVLTGDLGHQDAAGNVFVLGRERAMLNVAGKKVSPAEVEACLRTHPCVAEVTVTGVATPQGDQHIRATVVAQGAITPLELRRHCTDRLAAFKAPREIVFVERLSQGPLGKIRNPATTPETPPRPQPVPSWRHGLAIGLGGLLTSPWRSRCTTAWALRHPQFLPRYAGITGRLMHALGFSPPAAHVRRLFGASPTVPVDAIRREITVHTLGNIMLHRLARHHGLNALGALLRCHGAQQLLDLQQQKRGAILIFPHTGPVFAVPTGICQLGLPALLVTGRKNNLPYPAHVETWRASDSPAHGVLFLKHAVAFLRRGGFVFLALDGRVGTAVTTCKFMGGSLQFRHGVAALHQLTGAPVLPITAQWGTDSVMDLVIHAPLEIRRLPGQSREASTQQLMNTAVSWLEGHLRTRPGEVSNLDRHFVTGTEDEE